MSSPKEKKTAREVFAMERKHENELIEKLTKNKVGEELLRAAERGDAERVTKLLQTEGVDPRYAESDALGRERTPLLVACAGGHVETVRVLLEHVQETKEEVD